MTEPTPPAPPGRDEDLEILRVRMWKRIPFHDRGARQKAVDDLWTMYRLVREARDERDRLRSYQGSDDFALAMRAAEGNTNGQTGVIGLRNRAEQAEKERRAAEAQAAPAETAEDAYAIWWETGDLFDVHTAFLAGYAARGPALTPAELRTLYDLAFGHDPSDRWDEATEALRAKLRGLVGE